MTTTVEPFTYSDSTTTIPGFTQRIAGNPMGILSNKAYPTAANAFCGVTCDTPYGSNDVNIRVDLAQHVSSTICSPFIYLSYDTSGHGVIVQFSAGGGNIQALIGTLVSAGYDPSQSMNNRAIGSFVLDTGPSGDSVGVKLVGNVYTITHLSGGVMTDTAIIWNDSGGIATRDSSHRLWGVGGQGFLGSYWPVDQATIVDTVGGGPPLSQNGMSFAAA